MNESTGPDIPDTSVTDAGMVPVLTPMWVDAGEADQLRYA